jgi:hypothetical protein
VRYEGIDVIVCLVIFVVGMIILADTLAQVHVCNLCMEHNPASACAEVCE